MILESSGSLPSKIRGSTYFICCCRQLLREGAFLVWFRDCMRNLQWEACVRVTYHLQHEPEDLLAKFPCLYLTALLSINLAVSIYWRPFCGCPDNQSLVIEGSIIGSGCYSIPSRSHITGQFGRGRSSEASPSLM